VLFLRSGSILHTFTAVTPCAILDVLMPPYLEDHECPSTYFTDVSVTSLPGSLSWKRQTCPRVSPSPGRHILALSSRSIWMMVTTNYDSYDDRWRGRIG
jgi:hypothetical protein